MKDLFGQDIKTKEEIIEDIFERSNSNIQLNQIIKYNFDRKNPIIQLANGNYKNLLEIEKELNELLLKKFADYYPKFRKEYFVEIYRIKGLGEFKSTKQNKKEIAIITNNLIYGRFPKELLRSLQFLNPYKYRWKRAFKHHQLLTDKGVEYLFEYIDDLVSEMKKFEEENWEKFEEDFCISRRLNYQTKLKFENN